MHWVCVGMQGNIPVAEQMQLRATEVEQHGRYLGFFEWVIWAALRSVGIRMLFGSRWIDIGPVFGPAVTPSLANCRGTQQVVACRLTISGALNSAVQPGRYNPSVNHFVIGVPLHSSVATNLAHELQDSLLQATEVADTAVAAAQRAEWGIKLTCTTGDCALDVMAYYDRIDRNVASWKKLRQEISCKIVAVKEDPVWQQVFHCCCEQEEETSTGIVRSTAYLLFETLGLRFAGPLWVVLKNVLFSMVYVFHSQRL